MSRPAAPASERGESVRAGKWWGWGDPGKRTPLPATALEALAAELGPAQPARRVELDQVAMPEPGEIPARVVEAAGGPAGVMVSREHRVRRATGKGYADLIRLRGGSLPGAPDAVLAPGRPEQVAAVLGACEAEGVAVVPFGGGTSVVGGVDAIRGSHRAVVALDLGRLRGCEVDRRSLTARLGPGLRGPQAEAALAREGLTLGHFPQSFEYATIGGFAATRSAGQASSGYGRFDSLVTALHMAAPAGEISTLRTPHSAAGPALREMMLGSEGTLGVITEVTARVRPIPEARRYEGWLTSDFAEGMEAVRTLAQAGALPDVIRVSDSEETRVSLELAGAGGARRRAMEAYIRLRGRRPGCLVVAGFEGASREVARRRSRAAGMLRAAGAATLGGAPGRSWLRGRFEGPYLRDELLDLGYMVDTLETADSWSRLDSLYASVSGALRHALADQGTPGLVLCHLSHAYADGASLYFTFLARMRWGSEIEQWRAVKEAASEAIARAGATITHHHAVGRDHAPYMRAEVGPLGLDALRAVKGRLDPRGIMNPGKLLV